MRDSLRTGDLMKRQFTLPQVYMMRVRYAGGWGIKKLAIEYGVNRNTIWKIVHHLTYKDAGGPVAAKERICPRCRQVIGERTESRTGVGHE